MKRSSVITLALCAAASILLAETDKSGFQPVQKPYSENSVIVKKPSTPVAKNKAGYVEDKTASGGKAAFQIGKGSGWAVQWPARDFARKLKPGAVYVFKMRLRPEFEDVPDSDGFFLVLGFYNMKVGRGAFKVPFKAYDDGKYRDVYLFRTKVGKPGELKGYFYCTTNEKAANGAFKVWYDHIEFIPAEDFKDKALLKRLPIFDL